MRGTVAKKLRKAVYGTDFSPKARTYIPIKTNRYHVNELGTVRFQHVTIINTGLRRSYLSAKDTYMRRS